MRRRAWTARRLLGGAGLPALPATVLPGAVVLVVGWLHPRLRSAPAGEIRARHKAGVVPGAPREDGAAHG